ncbi:MAG: type II secretion system F family protein [Lysobacter sp.]
MAPGLTATVLAGATGGLGLALLVRELLPAQPQLAAALDRLAPPPPPNTAPGADEPVRDAASTRALETRVGLLAQRHLSVLPLQAVPARELALLRIPVARHVGQKVLLALIGLLFPAVFTALALAAGVALPLAFPALSSLVLAAVLFLLPDLEVRRKAAAAREEFARATSAYLDLTALERTAGAGATQALEQAATVGDSWVFVRLREQLIRARLSGTAPWDGLHELATELALPELSDLADIMRLSGEEGAAVADTLRARSRGLRTALLTKEQTRANENSERMVVPVAVLGLIFLVLLGAPAIVRIL